LKKRSPSSGNARRPHDAQVVRAIGAPREEDPGAIPEETPAVFRKCPPSSGSARRREEIPRAPTTRSAFSGNAGNPATQPANLAKWGANPEDSPLVVKTAWSS
jgi:hypothetical protein